MNRLHQGESSEVEITFSGSGSPLAAGIANERGEMLAPGGAEPVAGG